MNEQLQILAEQAGFTANDEQKVFLRVYEQELKKFAELIVEECAKLCEDSRPSKPEYDQRFYDGCTLSAYVIRNRMK